MPGKNPGKAGPAGFTRPRPRGYYQGTLVKFWGRAAGPSGGPSVEESVAVNHENGQAPEATVSAAAMRIVRLLIGKPPVAIASLIRATGVTRTAVTEQLNELVAAGFVERTTERLSGRGRPRHLYSTTKNALLLLFASNQQLLVPAIWQSIADLGGDSLVREVLVRVAQAMAEHYRPRIKGKTPNERLKEMMRLLNEEGGVVEVQQGPQGQLVLFRRSCPFFSMFEERTKAVCCIDQELISAVVGAPVRRTTCRHDGAPCCTFELVPTHGRG